MHEGAPHTPFEIGTFICPKTKAAAPPLASQPIAAVPWPVVVKTCARCGESHLVQRDQLRHAPILGYE